MTSDVEQTLDRMRALVEFIDDYPLTPEVRERMTYRDMRQVIAAKRRELSLDHASLNQDDEQIQYWLEQIGIAEDERELITEDHHLDLPLNFNWMPEYEPMLEAEAKFWEERKPEPIDTAPLFEIVRQYAPQPKA